MNTTSFKNLAALLAVGSLAWSATTVLAQDSSAPPQSAPQIGYGVSQILQLEQAKVGDDTIISYIRNSGNSYGLNADQIIYLRQQGVSSAVVNAMLSQPAPGVLAAGPVPESAPPASYDAQQMQTYSQPASPPSIVGPAVTGIDPTAAAAATYYSQPYYYPTYYAPYYYPAYAYGFYPGVSVSFGWRGGYVGGFRGGGFHGGGFHGGWHR